MCTRNTTGHFDADRKVNYIVNKHGYCELNFATGRSIISKSHGERSYLTRTNVLDLLFAKEHKIVQDFMFHGK